MVNVKLPKKGIKKALLKIFYTPLFYTLLALVCFGVYGFWLGNNIIDSFAQTKPIITEKRVAIDKDIPSVIVIPRFKITLPVEESEIVGENWQISEIGASFLTTSSLPGENGTIILYGHNKSDLFGPVKKISLNDEIHLVSKNGKVYKYKVVRTRTVDADDIDALSQITGETLVFYTCAGFADTKRFLIFAKPL